jgi:hypothetical protein
MRQMNVAQELRDVADVQHKTQISYTGDDREWLCGSASVVDWRVAARKDLFCTPLGIPRTIPPTTTTSANVSQRFKLANNARQALLISLVKGSSTSITANWFPCLFDFNPRLNPFNREVFSVQVIFRRITFHLRV